MAALHLLHGLASVESLARPGARGDQELDEARVVPVRYLLRQLHGHAAEAIVAVERPVRHHVERVGVVAIEGMDVGAGLDERPGGFVLSPPARPVERRGLVLPSLGVGFAPAAMSRRISSASLRQAALHRRSGSTAAPPGHYGVFPGEGVHSREVGALVRKLDDTGYRGDFSFEVLNDDYKQLPLSMVVARARRSVKWLVGLVSRRSLPARRLTAHR